MDDDCSTLTLVALAARLAALGDQLAQMIRDRDRAWAAILGPPWSGRPQPPKETA